MAAHIRINEVSREPGGLFYFDIDFWLTQAAYDAGNPPIISNDFRMQLVNSITRVAQDTNGFYLTTDGSSIDPAILTPDNTTIYNWKTETITLTANDIIAQIRSNIANFVKQAVANNTLRGDLRHRAIIRNQTDPSGILTKIAALKNYVGSS